MAKPIPSNTGIYLNSLTKEERVDYYGAQVAFWESVNKKCPSSSNRVQTTRFKRLQDKEIVRE